MRVLGIDPGALGALAIWTPETRVLVVSDMPVFQLKAGARHRSQVNAHAIAHWLSEHGPVGYAMIEQLQVFRHDSTVGAQSSGKNWGLVMGALAALAVRVDVVAPNRWKKAMGCSKDKDSSRARATQLLPDFAPTWLRKKDDGRAEAALIALYATRLFQAEQAQWHLTSAP